MAEDVTKDGGRRDSDEREQVKVPTSVQPTEPQNPGSAGATPSEQTSVLTLNTEGKHAQRGPEIPAGQHATGSFTGDGKK